jgi:hypothetical protein
VLAAWFAFRTVRERISKKNRRGTEGDQEQERRRAQRETGQSSVPRSCVTATASTDAWERDSIPARSVDGESTEAPAPTWAKARQRFTHVERAWG